ncbi:hypothetical protein RRG08_020479 [Elysia crispata]|uniref:Uncharacterized protein n=1 Tax=Elysia crispata TaxID=231223 RepID=A0AAE1AC36_9GAST|nr:hypothetical protein RRG08_020479 [Elysia crispata]
MVILAKQVNAEEKILPDTSFSIHHRKNNCVIAHGSKEMYELFPVDLNLLTKSNLRSGGLGVKESYTVARRVSACLDLSRYTAALRALLLAAGCWLLAHSPCWRLRQR